MALPRQEMVRAQADLSRYLLYIKKEKPRVSGAFLHVVFYCKQHLHRFQTDLVRNDYDGL